MKLHYDIDSGQLSVRLDGEIDHHCAGMMRAEVDAAIYTHSPRTLILDFQDVTFMDSSGIAVVMGAQRACDAIGAGLAVTGAAGTVLRIFQAAGIPDRVRFE